ncbi:hypothetical protein A8M52_39165 [Escherichia coli]|nr:hypothetical protein A8M52_39165 [Escherichia coli]RID06428.1 hypothetical protein D1912_08735 [Escherichia coli]
MVGDRQGADAHLDCTVHQCFWRQAAIGSCGMAVQVVNHCVIRVAQGALPFWIMFFAPTS